MHDAIIIVSYRCEEWDEDAYYVIWLDKCVSHSWVWWKRSNTCRYIRGILPRYVMIWTMMVQSPRMKTSFGAKIVPADHSHNLRSKIKIGFLVWLETLLRLNWRGNTILDQIHSTPSNFSQCLTDAFGIYLTLREIFKKWTEAHSAGQNGRLKYVFAPK